MAQYMKRASFGRMVTAEGGASDPELEEVRLTADEYNDLWRRIRSAERAAQEAKDEAVEREKAVLREANRQLREYEQKADADANSKVIAAQAAQQRAEQRATRAEVERKGMAESLEKQKNLNNNLKRIARERANAARGLTPKKEHSGYVVIYSTQYKQKYRIDYDFDKWREENPYTNKKEFVAYENKVADVWRSVLQTPYDASLPLNQVKDDIWNDLTGWALYQLGFRAVQNLENNGDYVTWYGEDEYGIERELCGLYKWSFKADYRSGLWEMDLYHTKSLKVPEEYRPVDRNRNKN